MPALANAAYAAVMASRVTSPDPSASEGTPGTDSMPNRSAARNAARYADVLQHARRRPNCSIIGAPSSSSWDRHQSDRQGARHPGAS